MPVRYINLFDYGFKMQLHRMPEALKMNFQLERDGKIHYHHFTLVCACNLRRLWYQMGDD